MLDIHYIGVHLTRAIFLAFSYIYIYIYYFVSQLDYIYFFKNPYIRRTTL